MANDAFAKDFGPDVVKEMNIAFNRLYWPLLTFFFHEEELNDKKSLTFSDFRLGEFNRALFPGYLRDLEKNETAYLAKEQSLTEKTRYSLTPHGRKMGAFMWSYLKHVSEIDSKKTGRPSVSAKILKTKELRKTNLDTEEHARDVEEEMLKKIEEDNERIRQENARRAGITKKENGETLIDLDKINIEDDDKVNL